MDGGREGERVSNTDCCEALDAHGAALYPALVWRVPLANLRTGMEGGKEGRSQSDRAVTQRELAFRPEGAD